MCIRDRFMGHGSGHPANDIYIEMNELFAEMGFPHAFVATVEGQPSVEQAVKWALSGGYKKVYLAPLMLVAGDHARNDMAGADKDSWKNRFEAAGIETSCVMRGLGEYEGIRALYLEPVSYTHLDVYKRQPMRIWKKTKKRGITTR